MSEQSHPVHDEHKYQQEATSPEEHAVRTSKRSLGRTGSPRSMSASSTSSTEHKKDGSQSDFFRLENPQNTDR